MLTSEKKEKDDGCDVIVCMIASAIVLMIVAVKLLTIVAIGFTQILFSQLHAQPLFVPKNRIKAEFAVESKGRIIAVWIC